MIKFLKHWLKWKLARKELDELHRWRIQCNEYSRWLAEFEDIRETLESLEAEVKQKNRYMMMTPNGPWVVSTLREVLRKRKKAKEVTK